MPFIVENKRRKLENIEASNPGAPIIDVTSSATLPWSKFSPFYPHGRIPVPFSDGVFGASVEGIWQGLKVFEHEDIDRGTIANTTMKNIKRSTRSHGPILGHRAGIDGQRLLSYHEARYLIYLPSYKWVLDHHLQIETKQLVALGNGQTVVLLDYEINANIDDLRKPLSHAALIVKYVTGTWSQE